MNSQIRAITQLLQQEQNFINLQTLLSQIIKAFDCTSGTLHTIDNTDGLLKIKASVGIPEFLMPKMSVIPIGKGMAGVAAERKQPVQICNLQTDDSGVARPSAKETKMEGSIAVPMLIDGKLWGVFGIAKPVPYDFTEEETTTLLTLGEEISKHLQKTTTV